MEEPGFYRCYPGEQGASCQTADVPNFEGLLQLSCFLNLCCRLRVLAVLQVVCDVHSHGISHGDLSSLVCNSGVEAVKRQARCTGMQPLSCTGSIEEPLPRLGKHPAAHPEGESPLRVRSGPQKPWPQVQCSPDVRLVDFACSDGYHAAGPRGKSPYQAPEAAELQSFDYEALCSVSVLCWYDDGLSRSGLFAPLPSTARCTAKTTTARLMLTSSRSAAVQECPRAGCALPAMLQQTASLTCRGVVIFTLVVGSTWHGCSRHLVSTAFLVDIAYFWFGTFCLLRCSIHARPKTCCSQLRNEALLLSLGFVPWVLGLVFENPARDIGPCKRYIALCSGTLLRGMSVGVTQ